MMNFLCRPDGLALAGLVLGAITVLIWVTVDPEFRKIPEDPVARMNKSGFTGLLIILGGGAGYVSGSVISFFIDLLFGPTC